MYLFSNLLFKIVNDCSVNMFTLLQYFYRDNLATTDAKKKFTLYIK